MDASVLKSDEGLAGNGSVEIRKCEYARAR